MSLVKKVPTIHKQLSQTCTRVDTHANNHRHTHTHTLTHSDTRTKSFYLSLFYTLTKYLNHSLSHKHTQSLFHTHSHTHALSSSDSTQPWKTECTHLIRNDAFVRKQAKETIVWWWWWVNFKSKNNNSIKILIHRYQKQDIRSMYIKTSIQPNLFDERKKAINFWMNSFELVISVSTIWNQPFHVG